MPRRDVASNVSYVKERDRHPASPHGTYRNRKAPLFPPGLFAILVLCSVYFRSIALFISLYTSPFSEVAVS
jgi:hypothetical protein